jgi:cytochrome c peroxidase
MREGLAMPRQALAGILAAFVIATFVTASMPGAFAQGAPDAAFYDAQREGLRLFSLSCGVCHITIQQRTKQYGPVLSRQLSEVHRP